MTSAVFTCIGALGTTPAGRGPSLESIYRVSLTVYFTTANREPLKKKKNPEALGTCPVSPLVKTALSMTPVCWAAQAGHAGQVEPAPSAE